MNVTEKSTIQKALENMPDSINCILCGKPVQNYIADGVCISCKKEKYNAYLQRRDHID